ncbi:MAG: virion morphogenesis protein [Bacteroidales bacterium]|nr:virion morphogenesis protein [Bacteroidales bacterium]
MSQNNQLSQVILEKMEAWITRVQRDLPIVMGKTAVDHFRENFKLGGFVNNGLQPWQDVKRRDPASPWHGFDYKGEKRTSYKFTRDRSTGKTKRDKDQKRLNFSMAATQRTPLNSQRKELYNSIRYAPLPDGVAIISDKPYSLVHNEGGIIKVFGKHPARLPKRQFIGESKELTEKIRQEIIKLLQ